jgi:CRP-like cAMP-binding protein
MTDCKYTKQGRERSWRGFFLPPARRGLAPKLKRRQIAELANLTAETTARLVTAMADEGLLKNREVTALDNDEQRALTGIVLARNSSLPYFDPR